PLRLGKADIRQSDRVVIGELIGAYAEVQQEVRRNLPVVLEVLGALHHPHAGLIDEDVLEYIIATGAIRVGIGGSDEGRIVDVVAAATDDRSAGIAHPVNPLLSG